MSKNAPDKKKAEAAQDEQSKAEELEKCGIIMPISTIDGCPESHWQDVREIINAAIEDAGFSPSLVSDADETGIIHKHILMNLYENPIVVCDVSGKNPNVMFELGLRLAFDKPTVIVKDDKTGYSFDTSPIKHIDYRRDLRFASILEFKDRLTNAIVSTVKEAKTNKEYSTFVKHFGPLKVAKLESTEVSQFEALRDEIDSLRRTMLRGFDFRNAGLRRPSIGERRAAEAASITTTRAILADISEPARALLVHRIASIPGVLAASPVRLAGGPWAIDVSYVFASAEEQFRLLAAVRSVIRDGGAQLEGNPFDG